MRESSFAGRDAVISVEARTDPGAAPVEIERAAPDAILQKAAGIDLRRMGWRGAPR